MKKAQFARPMYGLITSTYGPQRSLLCQENTVFEARAQKDPINIVKGLLAKYHKWKNKQKLLPQMALKTPITACLIAKRKVSSV